MKTKLKTLRLFGFWPLRWTLAICLGLGTAVATGNLMMTGVGAAGSCVCPNWTAPSGGLLASTNLSSATIVGGTLNTSNASSPDCTTDASTFVENTTNGLHGPTWTTFSVSLSNAQMTFRIWIEQGVGSRTVDIQVGNQGTGYLYMNMNPTTGAVNTLQNDNGFGSSVFGSTTPLYLFGKPGWEVTMSAAGVTATSLFVNLYSDNATGSGNSYTGDGVSSLVYWGLAVSTP
jgi:hypothetical protein